MKNKINIQLDKLFVSPDTTIKETLKVIDQSAIKIAIVVKDGRRLLGTVTDGDVRRAIINNISLDESVDLIMNKRPVTISDQEDVKAILLLMKQKRLHQIPVVDQEKNVIDLKLLDNIIEEQPKDNWVVLMAGGLGSRLRPLTDECPKPLLKVGNKPILEVILNNFIKHGFYKFYITVNYKAEMIVDYFGNGEKWGVEIEYIHETKRLGTVGALNLLPSIPDKPIFVMNGDVLTNIDFSLLLDYHHGIQSQATMCVREYDFQIPYGVVRLDNHRLLGIEEKPIHRSFVSAGIYVLDPKVLRYIPNDEFFDMPTLFEELINRDYVTSVFPIREYWCDIGKIDDYNKANKEFEDVFG